MYEEIEKTLTYKFNDIKLLKAAITHKSAEYEHKVRDVNRFNERLEFLGDAILEHVISEQLYRIEPSLTEGQMTKFRSSMVCEKALSDTMRKLGTSKYMIMGKCEEVTNGRDKDAILADMFEAILGAVYIDSDFDTARRVCLYLLKNTYNDVIKGIGAFTDYKTMLQEKFQVNGDVKIEYVVVKEEGPDHMKTYQIDVYINDKFYGRGEGKNKKEAQQVAASNALKVEYEI
ncbi:MAG: ribonuclease III [Clostridia bacterium]